MTLEEFKAEGGEHTFLHIHTDTVDVSTEFFRQAVDQIARAYELRQMGLIEKPDCAAEALLLCLLERSFFHGYTPEEKNEEETTA